MIKKLLLAATILTLLVPIGASAAIAAGWNAPNLTAGFISPTPFNGIPQGLIVNASSTITSNLTLATTTTGSLNGVITVSGWPYAKNSTGISQAVSQCGINGIGSVYLAGGNYTVTGSVTPVSNCHIYGAGKGVTNLVGGNGSGWDFINSGSTKLVNFSITDITIDLQNVANASGIQIVDASSSEVSRVEFKNGAAGGWMLLLGTANGATDGVTSYNNRFFDDDFINHAGTLEAFLVFNAENTQIGRMTEKQISSPGLGLWQKAYDTHITDFYCENSSNGQIYYNITVDRTTIDSPNFNNCGSAIVGAGTSDNGAFGISRAQGLKINSPVIIGGSNSIGTNALELGAVNDATVVNPLISGYGAAGIAISSGDGSASSSPTNWSVIGGTIKDNNQSNVAPPLHPGIFIATSTPSGLVQNGLIQGVNIYDDQASPTQKYPITFDSEAGAIQFNGITITDNNLNAPTSLGGTSIGLINSSTLGSAMQIYANTNYSGTSPGQAFSIASGITTFAPGFISQASTTIGNGTLTGGLTVFGGATTTGTAYFSGQLGNATSTPDSGASFLNYTYPGRAVVHVGDTQNNSETKLLVENGWSAAGGYGLVVQRNNSTPQFTVDGNGFVGIGTTTAGSILSIGGLTAGINFTASTSTFSNVQGINITNGCFAINSTCLTQNAGTVTSVNGTANQITSSGGAAPTLSLPNLVIFPLQASSTNFSNFGTAYFGGTATATISSTGALTVPTAIATNQSGPQITFQGNSAVLSSTNGSFAFYANFSGKTFQLADSSQNPHDTFLLDSGNFGVSSTTPGTQIAVGTGSSFINLNNAATSTFSSGLNILSGCYAVNGTCIVTNGASSTLLADNNSFTGRNTFSAATSSSFAITGLTNSLLAVNANGSIVATTSIGTNLLTGTLGVGNGGTGLATWTAANRIPYTTSATAFTSSAGFTFNGTTLTTPLLTVSGSGSFNSVGITGNSANISSNFINVNIVGNQTTANTGAYYDVNVAPSFTDPTPTDTLAGMYGIQANPKNASAGILSSQVGVYGVPQNTGTGTTTGMYAIYGNPQNTAAGTTTSMVAVYAIPQVNTTASGGVTNMQALFAGGGNYSTNGAVVTNFYDAFLATPSGTITNKYGLYQQDASSLNYFGGNVGITTATPNATLSLGTGITTIKAAVYDGGINTLYGMGVNGGKLTFGANIAATGTAQMVLTGPGLVGIGTTTPGTLLSLAGTTGIVASTTATSTFIGGGINLITAAGNTGCFAINGTCLSLSSFSGILPIANGGTATTTQVTNGVNYFDGTRITSNSNFTWDGSRLTVPGQFYVFGGTMFISQGQQIQNASNGSQQMGFSSNGVFSFGGVNVGIATTSPWRTLSVTGTAAINGLSAFATGDSAVCQRAGGELTVDSGVSSCIVSSMYVKHDITNDDGAMQRIMALNPVSFIYNDSGKNDLGLIAEKVAAVDPRYAQYTDTEKVLDGHTFKVGDPTAINWSAVTADLVSVVQSQQKSINALGGTTQRSVQENWQWIAIGLLVAWNIYLTLKKK